MPLSDRMRPGHDTFSINTQVMPDSETILAEAKTMYLKCMAGDWLIWHTEKRWIGYTNAGVIYFSNHDPALCQAIWLAHHAWRKELDRPYKVPCFASEMDMRTALKRTLESEGWQCHLESLTPYGRVDMRAMRGERIVLIEVKLGSDGNALKAALGQLLAYGHGTPDAELWLALPGALPKKFEALFQRYAITIVEVPCLNPME